MVSHTTTQARNGTVLVFGPQALSFSPDDFKQLRIAAKALPEWPWIIGTIFELSNHWEAFEKDVPKYKLFTGTQQLQSLHEWFVSDTSPDDFPRLSNLLLSPLVVVTQLVEYLSYHNDMSSDVNGSAISNVHGTKVTLGLCTGILSAFAVSLSKERKDLCEYTAKAVRLAMLIGGVVDSRGLRDPKGEATALATAWDSSEARSKMEQILQDFPDVSIENILMIWVV
jgi:hypothetical protein